MTDKKFTDEEIIKRLERCVKRGNRNYDTDIVLDLINRQKAEIERLKTENKIYIESNRVIGYQRDQRDKEIDELQKQIDGLDVRENKIKAEAYKEFAEKAKEEFLNLRYNAKTDRKTVKIEELKEQMDWLLHKVAIETVENLLKEMVGKEK